MLLAGESNIRESSPSAQSESQDLLMGAPAEVTDDQLRAIHIRLAPVLGKALEGEASRARAPSSPLRDSLAGRTHGVDRDRDGDGGRGQILDVLGRVVLEAVAADVACERT